MYSMFTKHIECLLEIKTVGKKLQFIPSFITIHKMTH